MTEELYIPMGVKPKNEIFNGFSGSELLQSLVFMAFGGAVCAIVYLFSANVAITIITFMASVSTSIIICIKDDLNQSFVDHISNMIRFADSQKIYPYRYMDEWKV